jgi:hypothetical protein
MCAGPNNTFVGFEEEGVMDKQRREDWLKAVFETRDAAGCSYAANVAPRLGMDPYDDTDDRGEWRNIGRYWKERGFIRGESTKSGLSYELVWITADGIRYVEGDLVQQAVPSVTFNVGNAYGSIFGTQQHAEMNVSFDFRTVEAELNRAEEEVEQRGGHDAAELKELIAEVRALHESGDSLDRGRLAKYLDVLQRNGWVSGPIAGTLLSIATGA